MSSANHHYVSEGILDRFCFDGRSVWYFSSRNRVVEKRNIGSIFKKRHINSRRFPSGDIDSGLEDFFARNFDDPITHITSRVLFSLQNPKNHQPLLTDEEFGTFVQFLYNHMKRTPDLHEQHVKLDIVDDVVEKTIGDYQEVNGSLPDSEVKKVETGKLHAYVESSLRVGALAQQNTEILGLMADLHLIAATPRNNSKQFIVASRPVAVLRNECGASLRKGSIEYWTTLAPNLALGLVRPNAGPKIKLSNAAVNKINSTLARQSKAIAGMSKELVLTLSKKVNSNQQP